MQIVSLKVATSEEAQVRVQSLPAWLTKTTGILLQTEPLWIVPILGYSYLLTLSLVPGPSWLAWVGLAIACIPFLLRKIRWGYLSIRSAFEIPVAIFLAGAIIGVIISTDLALSIRTFQSLLVGILFYYSAVNYQHPRLLIVVGGFLVMIFWFLVPVSAYIGIIPVSPTTTISSKLIGLLGNLPILTQPTIDGTPILTWGSAYGVALPMLVLAAILIGVLLFSQKTWLRIISLFFCIVLFLIMYSIASEGIERLFNGTTLQSRIDLWKDTIHMIKMNPISGLGLGMPLLFTYGAFEFEIHHPHNSYLEVYANVGIIGILAGLVCLFFLAKLSVSIIRGGRSNPWYSFGIGLLIATFVIVLFSIIDTFLSGHIAKHSGGYYYALSLVPWGLGAGLVMSQRIIESK
ncbi:O-antigen ligase family protein [Chloroflexota bacterium]